MALPATSPFGPPVNFTLKASRRMSMPSSFMVISANFTTPVEVTAYSLWLMPTFLLDMTPMPSRYPRRFDSCAICLDHLIVHVLVGAELDGLVLAVVVHHARVLRDAPLGDEDVEEGVDDAELEVVEPPRLLLPLRARAGRRP